MPCQNGKLLIIKRMGNYHRKGWDNLSKLPRQNVQWPARNSTLSIMRKRFMATLANWLKRAFG